MEILDTLYKLRPIIIFLIEITLCYLILKTNSRIKIPAFFLVLFLALYQLGEVLMIFTQSMLANILSFSSTSLLPVLGIVLLEKINFNKIKYSFVLFLVPLYYITLVIIDPIIFSVLSIDYCFIKYGNLIATSKVFFTWAMLYYLPFLLIGLILSFIGIYQNTTKEKITLNMLMLISYLILIPTPFLVSILLNHSHLYIVSTMCTLGIFTAILTYIMTKKSSEK